MDFPPTLKPKKADRYKSHGSQGNPDDKISHGAKVVEQCSNAFQFVLYNLAHANAAIGARDGKAWVRVLGFFPTLTAAKRHHKKLMALDDVEVRIAPIKAFRILLAAKYDEDVLKETRKREVKKLTKNLVDYDARLVREAVELRRNADAKMTSTNMDPMKRLHLVQDMIANVDKMRMEAAVARIEKARAEQARLEKEQADKAKAEAEKAMVETATAAAAAAAAASVCQAEADKAAAAATAAAEAARVSNAEKDRTAEVAKTAAEAARLCNAETQEAAVAAADLAAVDAYVAARAARVSTAEAERAAEAAAAAAEAARVSNAEADKAVEAAKAASLSNIPAEEDEEDETDNDEEEDDDEDEDADEDDEEAVSEDDEDEDDDDEAAEEDDDEDEAASDDEEAEEEDAEEESKDDEAAEEAEEEFDEATLLMGHEEESEDEEENVNACVDIPPSLELRMQRFAAIAVLPDEEVRAKREELMNQWEEEGKKAWRAERNERVRAALAEGIAIPSMRGALEAWVKTVPPPAGFNVFGQACAAGADPWQKLADVPVSADPSVAAWVSLREEQYEVAIWTAAGLIPEERDAALAACLKVHAETHPLPALADVVDEPAVAYLASHDDETALKEWVEQVAFASAEWNQYDVAVVAMYVWLKVENIKKAIRKYGTELDTILAPKPSKRNTRPVGKEVEVSMR